MILAAGLGTRLRPLTLYRPKPLVPIVNQPLLGILINQLNQAGVTRLAVNAHHLADSMAAFLENLKAGEMEIKLFHEPVILGTGGGIKNTASFWRDEPLLVINADLLTSIDVAEAYAYHVSHDNPVTLVMHYHEKYNRVRINSGGEILEFNSHASACGEGDSLLAFTGIHVLDPVVLDMIPQGVSHIIDTYLAMIRRGISIKAHVVKGHVWADIGQARDYVQLHHELLTGETALPENVLVTDGPVAKAEGVSLEPGARLEGWVSLGRDVRVKARARVVNSVLWDNVIVDEGAEVIDSVAVDGSVLSGKIEHQVVTPQGTAYV
jgi:mannose-1-phosphate guanylyltransferase